MRLFVITLHAHTQAYNQMQTQTKWNSLCFVNSTVYRREHTRCLRVDRIYFTCFLNQSQESNSAVDFLSDSVCVTDVYRTVVAGTRARARAYTRVGNKFLRNNKFSSCCSKFEKSNYEPQRRGYELYQLSTNNSSLDALIFKKNILLTAFCFLPTTCGQL